MTEMRSMKNKVVSALTEELIYVDEQTVLGGSNVAENLIETIKEDLNQLDRVVGDEVDNLIINFKYISKLTRSHHEMALAIEKMVIAGESDSIIEVLEKQKMLTDKIEQRLEAVITTLQFGDLVAQLLMHTSCQVGMLNIMLQRLDHQNDLKKEIRCGVFHERSTRNVGTVKIKTKRKPVIQKKMQAGEIELF